MNQGKSTTFAGLFNQVERIEIPMIQRDYAQGRQSAREIREVFLEAIRNALTQQPFTLPLDLDFIYGNLEDDGSGSVLAVLDGQQRLTTLFLLHWFLAVKEQQIDDFRQRFTRDGKSRFCYQTRSSSGEFFNALVMADPAYFAFSSEVQTGLPSADQQIVNSNWFFASWLNDPTVSACLGMLQSMEEKFRHTQAGLYQRLCSSAPAYLVFQYLNLQSFGLSDELYIKMNARGKMLTDFENFKAWLSGRHRQWQYASRFGQKLDQQWTDLFWALHKTEKIPVDTLYLRFFNRMAFLLACDDYRQPLSKLSEEHAEWFTLLRDARAPFSAVECEKHQAFGEADLAKIEQVLDFLSNPQAEPSVSQLLRDFLTDNDYVVQARFFALSLAIFAGHDTQQVVLHRWERVTNNLLNNQRLDSITPFIASLRALNEVLPYAATLYDWLLTDSKRPGFNAQWQEESLKAGLINASHDWEAALIHAENHPFLRGRVRGLLELAKDASGHQLETFITLTDKTWRVLNREILQGGEHLLERALLTLGDYLVHQGGNRFSFCRAVHHTLRERSDNWLTVTENPLFGQLLQRIGAGDITSTLRQIIASVNCGGWRELIVNNPWTISWCSERLVDKYSDDIYLLSKSTLRGYFCELRGAVLVRRMQASLEQGELDVPVTAVRYCEVYGDEYPFFVLTLDNHEELTFGYEQGKYSLWNTTDAGRARPLPKFFKQLTDILMPEDYCQP
ncbi:DUF262 domain-containing protein [Erwinia sorbitola]|uniref:DUF262 domain-containing protein n=1 Tax=Erwinia sorbitola TaxID=2681984 RepID=A0A6I6ESP0_9GAMM|nr:DUF262 domain-containing protein [Erwinia sorbitola]MTD25914.1 DUF262 domain-containing protein [Erwinia sorbitola]QGU87542.1 DUF262 domain-containing protein [Erwinia sorbitola]